MTEGNATEFARQYLEDLLSFFGLNIDIKAEEEDETIVLSVPSTNMNGFLIGEHGGNLRAIQHLVGLALKTKDYLQRVSIDVADYKKQRAERLAEQAGQWAAAVIKSGAPMELAPMSPTDRRTVHQTVGDISGVESESAGEGRDRHIVLRPKAE